MNKWIDKRNCSNKVCFFYHINKHVFIQLQVSKKKCLKIGKINYFLILLFYHKIKYIAFGFVKFYRFYNSLMVTALFALISKYRFTTNTRISFFFWWKLIIHQPLNRRKLSRPFKIINVVIFLTFKKNVFLNFVNIRFRITSE